MNVPRSIRGFRFFSELSYVLGGAVAWGAAGAGLGLLWWFLPPVAGTDRSHGLFQSTATAFGLGWWGGIFWCTVLAIQARQMAPPPAVGMLATPTWLAAGAGLAISAIALLAGLGAAWSIGVAIVAATLVARVWLGAMRSRLRQ
jgi:hypothetical protein